MGVVRAARLGRLRRSRAPELAELGVQPGPVDYASGTKGRVPLVFPRWQLPPLTGRGPGPLDPMWGDYTKVTYLHAKGEQIRYDASRCYSQAFLPLLCGAALRAPIWEGGNPIDQRSR